MVLGKVLATKHKLIIPTEPTAVHISQPIQPGPSGVQYPGSYKQGVKVWNAFLPKEGEIIIIH